VRQPLCAEKPANLRRLRCGSAATHFLGLRVRIPPGARISVVSGVCSTGTGLCFSSRGVLPTVVCLSAISKLKNRSVLEPRVLSSRDKKVYFAFLLLHK
jgi:hypothetical protein